MNRNKMATMIPFDSTASSSIQGSKYTIMKKIISSIAMMIYKLSKELIRVALNKVLVLQLRNHLSIRSI